MKVVKMHARDYAALAVVAVYVALIFYFNTLMAAVI